ncbi:MAG: hypothetical protein OQK25_05325, partial [Gammaproteobacteria bacterium]|nr:hypothetical protein [Gammaproteobacteria bacterium]
MGSNRSTIWGSATALGLTLLLTVWAVTGWAGGPSAEATVRFLDQKFKEHGGGFTMITDSEQSAQYTRIDPISISMPNDGYLILEVAEKGLTETAGLPVEEINSKL